MASFAPPPPPPPPPPPGFLPGPAAAPSYPTSGAPPPPPPPPPGFIPAAPSSSTTTTTVSYSSAPAAPSSTNPNISDADALMTGIAPRSTMEAINTLLVHTTRFLNRFASLCATRLLKLEHDLSRIETAARVLEAKLASIPDLTSAPAPPTQTQPNPAAPANAASSAPAPGAPPAAAAPPAAPEAALKPVLLIKDDPLYARFFRMLRMGVPDPAVRLKMQQEGLDAAMLDTPEAPSPNQPQDE